MALEGFTFDFMKVAPGMDAQLYHALNKGNSVIPNYGSELSVTSSGLTLTVQSGAASVMGRFIRNTTPLAVTVPANSAGFVVLTIDLTRNNTFTGTPGDDNYKPVNNQIRIERVASLTQQDLFDGGSIYHWPLAAYTSNGSVVTITNDYYLDKMPKGVNNILFTGSLSPKISQKMPGGNINRYSAIQITAGINGNYTSVVINTGGSSKVFGGLTLINLVSDTISKNWSMYEVEFSLDRDWVRIERSKEVTNSGGVSEPDVRITSVLGMN